MRNKMIRSAVVFVIMTICLFWASCDVRKSGVEIVFPDLTGGQSLSDLNMNYNLSELKKQKRDIGKYLYMYSDPIKTDYKIVEKLGFTDEDEVGIDNDGDDGTRWFKKDKSSLRIGKYGEFTYFTGAEDTFFEMPLDLNECKSIAQKYITELGLMGEDMSSQWTVNETSVESDSDTKVIGYGVNMFVGIDGIDAYGCNRITVNINGNGEVTDVYYSVISYNNKDKVSLIDVDEAIKRIEAEKCIFDIDDDARNLNFEKISTAYWNYEDENRVYLLPIYIFEGTSTSEDGDTDSFKIVVQADK